MRRGGGGQAGFAEAFFAAGIGGNRKLERIASVLDWGPVATLIDGLRPGRTGRPPYPPLVMVRLLLLQQWYGLSDVEVCEAAADRLSFRKFCGLSLDEPTPDDTTLCRFRTALGQAGLAEALMGEINRQLDARGLILKRGSIVDATLIVASVAPPTQREGEVVAEFQEVETGKRADRPQLAAALASCRTRRAGLVIAKRIPPPRPAAQRSARPGKNNRAESA